MFLIRVVESLQKFDVDFAIAGGVAVALHGVVRGTVDVDIIVRTDHESYLKTEKALMALGLSPRLPVSANDVFQFREEYITKRNMIAWSFVNYKNPGEVVDVIITSDLKKIDTVRIKLMGTDIPVLNRKALIKMKTAAGRPQDLEDVRALEALLEEK
jgi:hypothetical protein